MYRERLAYRTSGMQPSANNTNKENDPTLPRNPAQAYDHEFIDALVSAMHWQCVFVVISMLIQDSSLYKPSAIESISIALIATNLCMLLILIYPVSGSFVDLQKQLKQSLRDQFHEHQESSKSLSASTSPW